MLPKHQVCWIMDRPSAVCVSDDADPVPRWQTNRPTLANFFFFLMRFQLRKFSEPAGVRVHPNFGVHLQSSSKVSGKAPAVLSGKLHNL